MSFQVQVSGHSTDPHNEVIKAAAVAFANSVAEALGPLATVTLSGYSGDSTGYTTFGDADRYPAPAPAAETAAEPAVAVAVEPTTETAPAETAPDSTESAPTTPSDGA